jgi:uncharacterized protein (TIRG00374 family)
VAVTFHGHTGRVSASSAVIADERSARSARAWRRTVALGVAGLVALWLLRSTLGAVYGDLGDLGAVDWRWLVLIVGCEGGAFFVSWELNRLTLRTDRWFDVAVAQLSGNAASNVVPAGGPAGAAVQLRVLSEAGFDLTRAATSLGALSLLGVAGLLALPAVAAPFAVATGSTGGQLEPVLVLGLVLLVVVITIIGVLLTHDTPLEGLARAVQWLTNRVCPSRRRSDLPTLVLSERDAIRTAFGARPLFVGVATIARTALDYSALYLSLLAVGAHPSPMAVIVAFGAANVAGMIPLTPGGLGFVEVGLTATLVASGVTPAEAALATALYRLASTWLPVVAGFVGYGLFRYRHRPRLGLTPRPPSEDTNQPQMATA